MGKKGTIMGLIPVYILLMAVCAALVYTTGKVVAVWTENQPITNRKCVIIDAGHGGVDGGATSCTGILESRYNLEIALRLNDLMHLLGIDTVMIRTEDISVYTSGDTIAQKKISDLKERVRIVNNTENSIVVSIHQNYFQDERYSGPQVFYAPTEDSLEIAKALQSGLTSHLNPNSNRQVKKADGIYLMQHIERPGVLIECGFLSNVREEGLLRDATYQQKLCCVISTVVSEQLFGKNTLA